MLNKPTDKIMEDLRINWESRRWQLFSNWVQEDGISLFAEDNDEYLDCILSKVDQAIEFYKGEK